MLRRFFAPVVTLAIYAVLAVAPPAWAQGPGTLDATYQPIQSATGVNAIVVQRDGQAVIAGNFATVGNEVHTNIARLHADGTVDSTFTTTTNLGVNGVVLQGDGKLVLGGIFTTTDTVTTNFVSRINSDGTLDTSFNVGGVGADAAVNCVALQADGKILIGGTFTTYNGVATVRIARLNSDGTLDTSFNSGGAGANNVVNSIAVQGDGAIVIGGTFSTFNGSTAVRIARLNSDGSLDAGFNPGGAGASNTVNCVALQADGKILLGGIFGSVNGSTANRIARLNTNGSFDSSFNNGGTGGSSTVNSVAVQADGRIVVGGNFVTFNGTTVGRITRLNANGSLDGSFNPAGAGVNNTVNGVAVQADGSILVGGIFNTYNTVAAYRIARVFNSAPSQTMAASDASQVTWTRGGASPEVEQVSFELSLDSGATYTPLGNATRVAGTANWHLTGLNMPSVVQLRARARTAGGQNNSSSGLVEQVESFIFPVAPTVTTNAVDTVTTTTATMHATVNPGGLATTVTFYEGVSSLGSVNVAASHSDTAVSLPVSGFIPGTTHTIYAYATNTAGAATGGTVGFTLLGGVPLVTTDAATNITTTTATLNATVNPRGTASTVSFFEGFSSLGSVNVPAGFSPVSVGLPVSGFTPGTTHTIYAYVTNAYFNVTANTVDVTLLGGAPLLTTTAATAVTTTGATLNATVNPNGLATTVTFYEGVSSFGSVNVPAGFAPVNVSLPVSGFIPGTTHTIYADATNVSFNVTGNTMDVTLLGGAPTVTTTPATAIRSTSVTLHATVNPRGTASTVIFYEGFTSYGSVNVPAGFAPVNVSLPLTGLPANSSHTFYAYVTNAYFNVTGNTVNVVLADSDPFYETLALAKGATPGAVPGAGSDSRIGAGAVWTGFGSPTIDDVSGAVYFIGKWKTAAGMSGAGIFGGSPMALLVAVGDTATDYTGAEMTGVKFKAIKDPVVRDGSVAFLSTLVGTNVTTLNAVALYNYKATLTPALKLVARTNQEMPGTANSELAKITSVAVGNDNTILLTASLRVGPNGSAGPGNVTTTTDTGAWFWRGSQPMVAAVREGATLAGSTSTVKSFLLLKTASGTAGTSRGMGTDSVVTLQAGFLDGTSALVEVDSMGGTTLYASGAATVPGAAGATWAKFGAPATSGGHGGNEGIAFLGTLTSGVGGVTSANSKRLFLQSSTTAVVKPGDTASGLPAGHLFAAFKDPTISPSASAFAFVATAKLGTVAKTGIWWQDDSGTLHDNVAYLGGTPPAPAPASTWSAFTSLATAESGPIFTAKIATSPTTKLAGLWAMDSAGMLRQLILVGSPLGTKQVKAFTALAATTGSNGVRRSFTAASDIIVLVTFTDLSVELVKIDMP